MGLVQVGDKFTQEGIVFEIVEVMPYRTITNREMLQVSYKLIDKRFTSAVAHLWTEKREPIQPYVKDVVDTYIQMRDSVRKRSV